MGLDMYLMKVKKYPGTDSDESSYRIANRVASYLELQEYNKEHPEKTFTPKEWGCKVPTKEQIDFYKPIATKSEYGSYYTVTKVAYWRKANQIFRWFEENCAGGHFENCSAIVVEQEQLEELLHACKLVLAESMLIDGKVRNGMMYENGEWHEVIQDGKVVENPGIAQELLPTQDGFFFGSTEYNEWYIDDLKSTVEQLLPMITDTDFVAYEIYYTADW